MMKRILLIDDDFEEHEIFSCALEEIEDEVSYMALSSARQAIQALKSFELKPDMIFLDLNMPEMSGEEFIAAFKDCGDLHSIPLIIYSTSLTYSNKSPVWPGVTYALKKPGSFYELVESLGIILNTQYCTN
jgi:two-component system response regulator HydG